MDIIVLCLIAGVVAAFGLYIVGQPVKKSSGQQTSEDILMELQQIKSLLVEIHERIARHGAPDETTLG